MHIVNGVMRHSGNIYFFWASCVLGILSADTKTKKSTCAQINLKIDYLGSHIIQGEIRARIFTMIQHVD